MGTIISKRIEKLATKDALSAIADVDPHVAQNLGQRDARLVAAFERRDHDMSERWQVMIFAVAGGTECWSLVEALTHRDDHGTWVEDFETLDVQRTDAHGDDWSGDDWSGDAQSLRLFPEGSSQL